MKSDENITNASFNPSDPGVIPIRLPRIELELKKSNLIKLFSPNNSDKII